LSLQKASDDVVLVSCILLAAFHIVKMLSKSLKFSFLSYLFLTNFPETLIALSLFFFNLKNGGLKSLNIFLNNLDLILIEVDMILDHFNLFLEFLPSTFDLSHFHLLEFDGLLCIVELVNHGINLIFKLALLRSKLLSHLTHSLFMPLKFLFSFAS